MKNLIYVIALPIVLSCASKGGESKGSEQVDPTQMTESEHKKYLDSITAVVQALPKDTWAIATFTDEFGDKTKEKYVSSDVTGTFSNSATADSPLFVHILVTNTSIGIFLSEYNASAPAKKFIGVARIQLKNSDGKIHETSSAFSWNDSGGILIRNFVSGSVKDYDYNDLKKYLTASEGDIKCVIKDGYSSSYRFTVNTSGLKEKLAELK